MKEHIPFLAIKSENTYHFTQSQDIICAKADGSYSQIILKDGSSIRVAKNLKYLEKQLGVGFFRTHRSHLVNIQYIVDMNDHNSMQIRLKDNTLVPITKEKKVKLLEKINKL